MLHIEKHRSIAISVTNTPRLSHIVIVHRREQEYCQEKCNKSGTLTVNWELMAMEFSATVLAMITWTLRIYELNHLSINIGKASRWIWNMTDLNHPECHKSTQIWRVPAETIKFYEMDTTKWFKRKEDL